MRSISTIFLTVFISLVSTTEATTRKVPQEYATIQVAVNAAANGDTILVAEGTYLENIVITKKIILGSRYIIDKDTSHISKTILDGGIPTHPDSASVIRTFAGSDTITVISGFTIRNGKGTKLDLAGTADWVTGGGILIFAGGATITYNSISNNTLNSALGVYGGGITVDPYLGPINYWIIDHNNITNNVITSLTIAPSLGAEGGGVWLTGNGRFMNNVVSGNIATSNGTHSAGGGISLIGSSTVLIANNNIRNNFANNGGGFWMGAATQTTRPSVTVQNNLVISNSGTSGAAMNILSGDFKLINNTIAYNYGDTAIKLFNFRGGLTFLLLNNIVWNPEFPGQIFPIDLSVGSYNNVRSGMVGTGNINTDPLFVPNNSMYPLSDSSRCIGAGSTSALVGSLTLNAPLFDYFNSARPRAADSNPDMGAVENDRSFPVTSVKEIVDGIPVSFDLNQNYPNPFNPTTSIGYALPFSAHVKLTIHDILGREIAILVSEEQTAGWKEVTWNAKDVSSGIYFYKLTTNNFVEIKKMMVLK